MGEIKANSMCMARVKPSLKMIPQRKNVIEKYCI
jgi:hypothetical protein